MNRAAASGQRVDPRIYYTVTYIPGGFSETLERNVPTDEYADDDYAVEHLLQEAADRGDEPLEIRRGGRWGKVLWENRSYA
jgi:hypothetical protein